MKNKVKNTVFNTDLQQRIARLEYLYKTAITAENFTDINSSLITKAGTTLTELKLQYGANINGIEMSDMESFLRFLENTNIEHKALPIKKLLGDASSSSDRTKKEYVLSVPEGWDARNGFLFYRVFGVHDEIDTTVTLNASPSVIPMEKILVFNKDQYITVTQNKKNVIINSYIREDLTYEGSYDISGNELQFDYYELRGYLLMWRNR